MNIFDKINKVKLDALAYDETITMETDVYDSAYNKINNYNIYAKCLKSRDYNIFSDKYIWNCGKMKDYVVCTKNEEPYTAFIVGSEDYAIKNHLTIYQNCNTSYTCEIYDFWKILINNTKYYITILPIFDGTLFNLLKLKIKKNKTFYNNLTNELLINKLKNLKKSIDDDNIIYNNWDCKNILIKINEKDELCFFIIDFELSCKKNVSTTHIISDDVVIDNILFERLIGLDKYDKNNIPDMLKRVHYSISKKKIEKKDMFVSYEFTEEYSVIENNISNIFLIN
jgi:hypothetical protein